MKSIDLNYDFVVFNPTDGAIWKNHPDGYYTICVEDLKTIEGVTLVTAPLDTQPIWLRFLFGVHNSKRHKLPMKKIWYPLYFKRPRTKNKPLCFVFIQHYDIAYCQYLKRLYPYCKIVLIMRDLRRVTEDTAPGYCDNPVWDMIMTIDENEARDFGWIHIDEFESKISVPKSKDYPESDVFFAGKAKDRLPRLLKIYDILTSAGLNCQYYLIGVPKDQRKELPGIVYSDQQMKYTDMLYHTVNTRCVLEINQEEAVGYTSRFLEAVMFNKRLVTDNMSVKKNKFYDPAFIQCLSNVEEISPDFVKDDREVNYHYTDEFSPVHLIKLIDKYINERK